MVPLPAGMPVGPEALARSALFSRLDPATLADLSRSLARRSYRRGEVIFHEGDPGDALYLIERGRVRISRASPDGEEAIMATLRADDTFGELVLLDGAPRSATATALEPTDALTLTRTAFLALLERDAGVRRSVLAGLAAHLRRLTDQLAELHFLDLAGRLAAQLARMAGEAEPGRGTEVRLGAFTQQELAAMIGGTRQRVNRILGDFVAEGLVRLEGDVIVVVDVERLVERTRW